MRKISCWVQAVSAGTWAAALFAAVTISASAIADQPAAITVSIDQLPKRDTVTLGSFPAGETVTASIVLQSKLGKSLSIRSVTTDCGCLRVDHDQQDTSPDGDLELQVQLAPSRKVGRIRRHLRVFFAEEPTAPLELGLDTLVVAPLAFRSSQVEVQQSGDTVELIGFKKEPHLELLECLPARGSCRVVDVEQTSRLFKVRICPLISFGSANEVFRIRYRADDHADASLIELPIELRCVSPLRFFPSVAPIDFERGAWRASARLAVTPGNDLDLKQLQLSIELEDGTIMDPSDYEISLQKTSIVLYALHVRCVTPKRPSDRPARLKVASPNGKLLATLDFSSP